MHNSRIGSKAMKLSDQLQQDHDCGDFGKALEGYAERAKKLEDLLLLCVKDLFSSTGKFKKKTAIELSKYVREFELDREL
jgi:hypothetical protein